MLYYAREVDGTLMTTLNGIAYAQVNGTQAMMRATKSIMDYCHTHSYAMIQYCAIQMQLHIHNDASYLSSSKSRSRVGGNFFLSDHFDPISPTKHNSAVLVVTAILKQCISFSAEAELGGLFFNTKEGEVIRNKLE